MHIEKKERKESCKAHIDTEYGGINECDKDIYEVEREQAHEDSRFMRYRGEGSDGGMK